MWLFISINLEYTDIRSSAFHLGTTEFHKQTKLDFIGTQSFLKHAHFCHKRRRDQTLFKNNTQILDTCLCTFISD